jgi:hypothetical protein
MKVYLQNVHSGEYVRWRGGWTSERERSWNLKDVVEALELSQNFPELNLDVVIAFEDGGTMSGSQRAFVRQPKQDSRSCIFGSIRVGIRCSEEIVRG